MTEQVLCIAEGIAQKFGLSLPGDDKTKVAGAMLAFEAIKSASELLFPTIASSMCFNSNGFTLALIQKKLNEMNKKIDMLIDVHLKSAKDLLITAMIYLQVWKFNWRLLL